MRTPRYGTENWTRTSFRSRPKSRTSSWKPRNNWLRLQLRGSRRKRWTFWKMRTNSFYKLRGSTCFWQGISILRGSNTLGLVSRTSWSRGWFWGGKRLCSKSFRYRWSCLSLLMWGPDGNRLSGSGCFKLLYVRRPSPRTCLSLQQVKAQKLTSSLGYK